MLSFNFINFIMFINYLTSILDVMSSSITTPSPYFKSLIPILFLTFFFFITIKIIEIILLSSE